MIESPISIEYDVDGETYVLLAVGGTFSDDGLLKVRGEQDLYERDGYLQAEAWFEPLGGATATVTFSIEEEFPTLEEAQAVFNAPDEYDGVALMQATGTLRITAGDTVAEWSHAVLQDVNPELPADGPVTLIRAFTFLTPAAPVIS